MKKILIVYASKTGSTATAAGLLADKLTGRDVTLCTTEAPEADPTGYDIVVVGGSIRFSKLYKPVREYLRMQIWLKALPKDLRNLLSLTV